MEVITCRADEREALHVMARSPAQIKPCTGYVLCSGGTFCSDKRTLSHTHSPGRVAGFYLFFNPSIVQACLP